MRKYLQVKFYVKRKRGTAALSAKNENEHNFTYTAFRCLSLGGGGFSAVYFGSPFIVERVYRHLE